MSIKKVNNWNIREVELVRQLKDFRIISEWVLFTKYWKFLTKENVCLAQLKEYQYRRANKKIAADGVAIIKKIYKELNTRDSFWWDLIKDALGQNKVKDPIWKEMGVDPHWLNNDLSLWWTEKSLFWTNDELFEGLPVRKTVLQALNSGTLLKLKYWKFYYARDEYRFILLWYDDYQRAKRQLNTAGAGKIGQIDRRNLWWSKQGLFWADTNQDDEEVQLLLWDRQRKHESKLDRLRSIRASKVKLDEARRERIPDEVRAFVWERDEQRCVKCGSQEDLQFDHIIPVAKGGGNSMENIQILCGECNRMKRDNIV